MLPSGRARLLTRPASTGSATTPMTIGMLDVACLAARAGCRSFDQHDVDGQPNQFGGEFWQSVGVARSRAKFKDQIMPFNISEPTHLLTECCEQRVRKFPTWCKDADARRPTRRLRPRRKRPRHRCAAEQRDEVAPLHSMTSSARASTLAGISMPSALAVLRLMTSSYLVGACTGRSAGFSPLRMRSTYPAARRY